VKQSQNALGSSHFYLGGNLHATLVGMRTLHLLALIASLLGFVCARASLLDVRQAAARLGPETWSLMIEIENRKPDSAFPRKVYALVFEFNRILWLFTPYDGTRSLSTHRGQPDDDRENLLPLLHRVHRGFQRFTVLPASSVELPPLDRPIRNGCFVESLASARARVLRGETVLHASILLFYARSGISEWGHAVLAYETPRGIFIDDPRRTGPNQIQGTWSDEPLKLAGKHVPELSAELIRARTIPVTVKSPANRFAASP